MYAPTMIVVSLMGMDPTVAFPIMMGASAFGPLRHQGYGWQTIGRGPVHLSPLGLPKSRFTSTVSTPSSFVSTQ